MLLKLLQFCSLHSKCFIVQTHLRCLKRVVWAKYEITFNRLQKVIIMATPVNQSAQVQQGDIVMENQDKKGVATRTYYSF